MPSPKRPDNLPLAMSGDFSSDDWHHRECTIEELTLFAEMALACDFHGQPDVTPTDEQHASIAEVGAQHLVPADKATRFFRRMRDVADKRGLSLAEFLTFWRGMRQPT